MGATTGALVTGARRGIGKAIAIALAETGCDIVINHSPRGSPKGGSDDLAGEVKSKVESLGQRAFVFAADLCQSKDRKALVNFALEKLEAIHVLVNNAGVAPENRQDMLSLSEESFDRVLAINLKGTFFLSQVVANSMIERVKVGDTYPYKIINVSSISAYTSSSTRAEYCISKAGVSMVTKLYADRLAEFGINVYEIRPGIVATDMTRGVKDKYDRLIEEGLTPIKRWGTPKDIGKAVAAIASDALPFSTGEVINVDGGFHLRRL